MPNGDKDVCSQSWTGPHGGSITLKNEGDKPVTVSKSPNLNLLWPFKNPTDSFTVDAKSGNAPGTYATTLVDTPGSNYGYATAGCHGDSHKTLTNPKTVIIT